MTATAARVSEVLSTRPRYLVVFRERSERNITRLSQVLKTGEARGMSLRAGSTVLATPGGYARMYQRMSVAATDLDADQLEKLRQDEGVRAVVLNEERFLPRPVAATNFAMAAGGPGDATVAYLEGMRDAAIAALSRLGVAPPVAAPMAAPHIRATGDPAFSWCLQLIGMSSGYQVATGRGVTVAVLDTGIDLHHPDFAGRVVEGQNTESFVAGQSVQDSHGHGTHCAGIVAGPVVTAGGVRYGVAPDADLVIGKVLSNAGSGSDDKIIDGIDWARDQGAQVVSMSLGSIRQVGQPFSAAYEQVAAVLLADGVLLVAAAGNESNRPAYRFPVENPAAAPSIMSVAAVDRDRKVGWFSCAQLDDIGNLDIAGPGVAVYSSFTGGAYKSLSGTSMATPHVAGVAALYRQQNPALRGKALWETLTSRALHVGDASDFGPGLVQVPA